MAKSKNKKTLRDDPTPFISRSYDPYSMEKRIYNLEQGGGVGPTPTPSLSLDNYSKTVTTTSSGWWVIQDKDGVDLDPTKHVLVSVFYEKTNEGETNNDYVTCEALILSGKFYLRFVTMLNTSEPITSSTTHKVHVTYYTIPE